MLLKEIQHQGAFIHLERWVNTPKYSPTAQYTEVSAAYHPRFGEESFNLPVFSIPRNTVELFEALPSVSARNYIVHEDRIRFFVHPDALNEFTPHMQATEVSAPISVAPSASSRSVIPLDDSQAIMLKLHLNKKISRFIRRLTRNSIAHSIAISGDLEKASHTPHWPATMAFLPESIGVSFLPTQSGFLLRELTPRPCVHERRILIPFFTLYSKDLRSPYDALILQQLISLHAPQEPLRFFVKHILDPLIGSWAYAFLRRGLLLESHGQNTLLEIDEQYRPCRIVHRDFQSVPVDPAMRRKNHIETPFQKHVIGTEDYPKVIEHSLMFDHFVGDYLLGAFAEFFEKHYRIPKAFFQTEARRIFRASISERIERAFFPPGHVQFGDTLQNNRCTLTYIPERPDFRPGY